MTVNYEVKDLIQVLLKKWYVIASVVIMFAVCAVPFSKASYEYAVTQYSERTSFQVLYEEEKEKYDAAKFKEEQVMTSPMDTDISSSVSITAFFSVKEVVPINVADEVPLTYQDKLRHNQDIVRSICDFTMDDLFLVPIFNKANESKNTLDYASFKSSISLKAVSGTNLLQLRFAKMPEMLIETFINSYPADIMQFLNETTGLETTLKLERSELHETPNEPKRIVADEAKLQLERQARLKQERNLTILKKPSLQSEQIKYMGSAGIFGGLVGCFLVLLWDFAKRSSELAKKALKQK